MVTPLHTWPGETDLMKNYFALSGEILCSLAPSGDIKKTSSVQVIEMSYPWIENVNQKHQAKTTKYAPPTWEIKQQYLDYTINQYNIVTDVLGGYSSQTKRNIRSLFGSGSIHFLEGWVGRRNSGEGH